LRIDPHGERCRYLPTRSLRPRVHESYAARTG
jgi:hypothetical protein